MSGAEFAGILGVVVEVLVGEQPVLVSDQAVPGGPRRVELDLKLHVLGQGHEGSAHLLDQDLARLEQAVDIVEVAVSAVGDLLHLGVLEVPGAETEDREEGSALALPLDQAHHLGVAGGPDVEIAVGGEDDAIVPAVDPVLARNLVRQLESGAARRAATGPQVVQRGKNLALVAARRRWQHQTRRAGVNHDGHPVLRPQLIDQQREGLLEERQLVWGHHRSGDVEQEDEVGGRQVLGIDRFRVQSDSDEPVRTPPGSFPHLGGDREGVVAGNPAPIVGEVVDHLLDPHRVDRGPLAGLNEAPDVGIRRPVHVDREGGKGRCADQAEVVFPDMRVRLGVEFAQRGERKGRGRCSALPGFRFGCPHGLHLQKLDPGCRQRKVQLRRLSRSHRHQSALRGVADQLGGDPPRTRWDALQQVATRVIGQRDERRSLDRDLSARERLARVGVGHLARNGTHLRLGACRAGEGKRQDGEQSGERHPAGEHLGLHRSCLLWSCHYGRHPAGPERLPWTATSPLPRPVFGMIGQVFGVAPDHLGGEVV